MSADTNHILRSGNVLSYTFFATFLVVTLFAGLLIQIGSPFRFVMQFMLTFAVSSYVFIGILARTMSMNSFQDGDRQGKPSGISQAIASGVIGSGIYILLAGEFYDHGTGAFALYWGWLLGVLLIVVLFTAFVARSAQVTLPALLETPTGKRRFAIPAILATLCCSMLFLLFQLDTLAGLGETHFFVTRQAVVYAACISIGFCVLASGLQGVAIIRQISFPVMLVCFLAPLVWITLKTSGIPVPQLAFGMGALAPVDAINSELLEAGISERETLFDLSRESAGVPVPIYLATVFCLACGLAAMPHLLQHFAMVRDGRTARRTGRLSFWMVLGFLSMVPIVAAYVKLDLYTSLLGVPLSDLDTEAGWLFALSGAGRAQVISICGAFVSSTPQAIAACGQGSEHFISFEDIGVNAGLMALASPALHQLPPLVSAAFATGALFALFTTIDGIMLNLGLTVSNDGYRRLLRPQSPKSVRLFMTRIFILLVVLTAGYITLSFPLDSRLLFEAGFALTAAALFPALVGRIWFDKASAGAISACVVSGFVVTAGLLWLANFGADMALGTGDEIVWAWTVSDGRPSGFVSGMIGMLSGFLTLFLFPLFLPRAAQDRSPETQIRKKDTHGATA